MENKENFKSLNLLSEAELRRKLESLNQQEKTWLAGYFKGQAHFAEQLSELFEKSLAGLSAEEPNHASTFSDAEMVNNTPIPLSIMYGSHSGNGKSVANKAADTAKKRGFEVELIDMAKFRSRNIKNIKNLLLIVSTHDEGEPPAAAEELHEFILSKKAPKLNGLKYSVLSLGDKSYVYFCKIGIDFDEKFKELGATTILDRVDCDVDFEQDAENWINNSLNKFEEINGAVQTSVTISGSEATANASTNTTYNQHNPFDAEVLTKVNLNGKGSEKETYHIELDIADSGMSYQVGDSLGVLANNPNRLVDEILETAQFSGSENIFIDKTAHDLRGALTSLLETTVLTVDNIRKYNSYAESEQLTKLLTDPKQLSEYLYGRDFVDLLKEFPVVFSPQELVDSMRKLPSRLYSISSSMSKYTDEVHLTVGAVRYNSLGRYKEGAASSFLSDRIEEGTKIPVYIKANEGFRLPEDPSTKIIMIGPGTGVAPFRAFVDERAELGHPGNSWLFFGNPHFNTDFLYQTEWLDHIKNESLSRLNVAFSRDQKNKVYVQHKIKQQGKDVYSWLNDNAHIYVCGDKNRMAKDVEKSLVDVIQEHGGKSHDDALHFIKSLKRNGRYQEDVY